MTAVAKVINNLTHSSSFLIIEILLHLCIAPYMSSFGSNEHILISMAVLTLLIIIRWNMNVKEEENISRWIINNRKCHGRELLDTFRRDFKWEEVKPFRGPNGVARNHAHSRLANLRCQATRSINALILSATHPGTTPIYETYDVSTSTREKQFNIAGDRGFYDFGDLNQEVGVFNVNASCKPFVYTFIDTDYYVDLADYSPNPMIIYTTIPQKHNHGNFVKPP